MPKLVLEFDEKRVERKTLITIECHDGTRRIITSAGMYNNSTAAILGKDLEGPNYKAVQTKIL